MKPGDVDELPSGGAPADDAAPPVVEEGLDDGGAPVPEDAPATAPAMEAEVASEGTPATEAHSEQPADQALPPISAPVGIGLGLAMLLVLGVGSRAVLSGKRAPAIEATPVDAPPAHEEAPVVVPPEDDGLVSRFRGALGRSREALQDRFDVLFGRDVIDEELFSDLEETLLRADVGLPTTERLLTSLRARVSKGEEDPAVLRQVLREEIRSLLLAYDPTLRTPPAEGPWVILVVGVNGSGKTTTIGKLAARLKAEGRSVLLAAGDTYRAAAAAQLKVWAERSGVDIVAHEEGVDPGAVIYDAIEAAKAREHDVIIVDTAGRLQTRKPLMEQLGKIRRVIDKKVPGAPHETLLVLDGTMGQNGLSQARLFNEATPLTGAVITKLDGTAKGGMVLTLGVELDLPVKFVGIGEGIDDLKPFDPEAFADALA